MTSIGYPRRIALVKTNGGYFNNILIARNDYFTYGYNEIIENIAQIDGNRNPHNPTYLLGKFPKLNVYRNSHDDMANIVEYISLEGDTFHINGHNVYPVFNFETVDGDFYPAHIGIEKESGKLKLFGDDNSYLFYMDYEATHALYVKADII